MSTVRSCLIIGFFFVTTLLSAKTKTLHPAFAHAPIVSFAEIESWVRAPHHAISSVEQLLERLPQSYRRYNVLIFSSRSMHRASLAAPRVVFYGPDARLLTAISTDPEDPRYHVAEFFEYEPSSAQFHTYEINFGLKAEIAHAPIFCKNCHRADLRPNWDPYDVWPGVYGSIHDTLASGSLEAHGYENLRNEITPNARLKYLPGFLSSKNPEEPDFTGYRVYTLSGGIASSGTLSLLLGFINRERIVQRIMASTNQQTYRYALAAAMMNCPQNIEEFLPEKVRSNHPRSFADIFSETKQQIEAEHTARLKRTSKLSQMDLEDIKLHANRYGLRNDEIRLTAALRYLLENRTTDAVNVEAWSLTLSHKTYTFNDGVSGLENLIGHYARLAFADSPDLAARFNYRTIPYIATSFNDYLLAPQYDPYLLEVYQREGDNNAVCRDLLTLSRQ